MTRPAKRKVPIRPYRVPALSGTAPSGTVLILFMLCLALNAKGQEICGNGEDDDGNGLIDTFDPACQGVGGAPFTFVGLAPGTDCVGEKGFEGLTNNINTIFSNENIAPGAIPIVIDLDPGAGNGPEIITLKEGTGGILMFSHANGELSKVGELNTPALLPHTTLLAVDIDPGTGNGPELLFLDAMGTLYLYGNYSRATGTMEELMAVPLHTSGHHGLSATDIEGDGAVDIISWDAVVRINKEGDNIVPEVYRMTRTDGTAFDPMEGALRAGASWLTLSGTADFLDKALCVDCDGMEFLSGATVASFGSGGTLTELIRLPGVPEGATSIADVDGTPGQEAIVQGKDGLYIYNPLAGILTALALPMAANGTGKVTVTDMGPDAQQGEMLRWPDRETPELLFTYEHDVKGPILVCYGPNADKILWERPLDAEVAGMAVSTFDFNGDGYPTGIFQDRDGIHFIDRNGDDVLVLDELANDGATLGGPIIADTDANGAANVISSITDADGTRLAVISSGTEGWTSARQLWHQYQYGPMGIGDDASVPTFMQGPVEGLPFTQRYATLSGQLFTMDSRDGSALGPLADLVALQESAGATIACDGGGITLSFNLASRGGITAEGPTEVSIYLKSEVGVGLVHTFTSMDDYPPGGAVQLVEIFDKGNLVAGDTLLVMVGGNGLSPDGTPLVPAEGNDCDLTNNLLVLPLAGCDVPILTLSDNSPICTGDTLVVGASLGDGAPFPEDAVFEWQSSSDNGVTWTTIGDAMENILTVPGAITGNSYRMVLNSTAYADGIVSDTLFPEILERPSFEMDIPAMAAWLDLGNGGHINVISGDVNTLSVHTGLQDALAGTGAIDDISRIAPGKYYISLGNGTCQHVDSLSFEGLPQVMLSIDGGTVLCEGEGRIITSPFYPDLFYGWQKLGVGTVLSGNDSLNVSTAGNYYLLLTDINGTGVSSDTLNISIPNLDIDAGEDITIDAGEGAQLMASGNFERVVWSPSMGLSDATSNAPIASPENSMVYTVTAFSIEGCQATDSIKVTVVPEDLSYTIAVSPSENICIGDTVSLSIDPVPDGGQVTWSREGEMIISGTDSYDTGIGGSYWATVTIDGRTVYTDTVMIMVDTPVLSAGEDMTIKEGEGVLLTAEGNGTSFMWTPGDDVAFPLERETDARPMVTTVFTVEMATENGCTISDSILVEVVPAEGNVEVSNIITPNGDGLNDTWIIEGIDLYPGAEVIILDKWGVEVFTSVSMGTLEWDGTSGGRKVPRGNYIYLLELGQDKEMLKGTLTVIY